VFDDRSLTEGRAGLPRVTGQLFPGVISVFRPIDAASEAIGMPCIVFAGAMAGFQLLGEPPHQSLPGSGWPAGVSRQVTGHDHTGGKDCRRHGGKDYADGR
jgi:hypothetical protein